MFFFGENSVIGFNVISTLSHRIELLYFSRMSVSLDIRWGMKGGATLRLGCPEVDFLGRRGRILGTF